MEKTYKVENRILGNGLKVIYAPDNSHPLLSMHLYVRIGSAWEDSTEAGYSHFTEHLVFKSTVNYPKGLLLDKVAYLGGSINAYTDYDSTCYYIEISSKYVSETVKILSDLVQNPDFSEKDFRSEKSVIFQELIESENDPEDFLIDQILGSYLKGNPYSKPIIGNRKSLETSTRKDLQEFISRYYFPANCFLVIAGDYDKELLDKTIDDCFGNWRTKKLIERIPYNDSYTEKINFTTVSHKSRSDVVAIALPALSESKPDAIAMSLIIRDFALGKNSYLYEELFKRKKLIDNIKIDVISGINDGAAILMLFPKQNVEPQELIKQFYLCWHDYCTRGISAVKLMKLKAETHNAWRISREYVDNYAASLGSEEIVSSYENFLGYPANLQKITRLDIRRIIDNWFLDQHLAIYYQGKKRLKKNSVLKIIKQNKLQSTVQKTDYGFYKVLNNGMRVLYYQIKGKPTAGISASFGVSQLYENEKERGINYLTSALMLYGNQLYSYDKFLDFCSLHGMTFGVNHQIDITNIQGKCFKEDLPLALEAFSSIVFEPELPREHFENIKAAVLSSWDRVKDYPPKETINRWKKLYLGSQSKIYKREGQRYIFKKQTLARIKKWHHDHYTPSNMILVITGDYDYNDLDQAIEKYFNQVKDRHISATPDYSIFPSQIHKKIADEKSSQGVIVLGGNAPSLDDRVDSLSMNLLCNILGGDTNSLLFNELREKHGMAYSVQMEYFGWKKGGAFISCAIVDRDNVQKGIKIIKTVLKSIVEQGVSDYELQKVKNHIFGQMLQQEESVDSIAASLSSSLGLGYSLDNYLNRYERLSEVTVEQIHSVATKYLHEDNYYIQVLK